FRVDARGWLLVGLGGGILVALFELAYQFAIAGAGVAGAAALLYTAPVIVAVLARVILKKALTTVRLLLAVVVMVGVALTVTGGSNAGAEAGRLGVGAGLGGAPGRRGDDRARSGHGARIVVGQPRPDRARLAGARHGGGGRGHGVPG